MANKTRGIKKVTPLAGRKPKFGLRMERQVSVGLDASREAQLQQVRDKLQQTSAGVVTESDVFRHAFDLLVKELFPEQEAVQRQVT